MTVIPPVLDVGQRIRSQMKIKRLTVERAADLCGLPKSSLETYLYHKVLPGTDALACLSQGLGCTTDWLLFGEVAASRCETAHKASPHAIWLDACIAYLRQQPIEEISAQVTYTWLENGLQKRIEFVVNQEVAK
jgi:transcriptional regulator with XRE-family HTH domain